MRITGVRTTLYEYEVRRPIGDVQLPQGARQIAELAVFLTTDEGITGVAIGAPAAQPIVHALTEQLVGRDPREVRGLYELMLRLTFKAGPDGVIGKAVAALDTALWDLRAKQDGVPLWRELGGSSDRAAAYASGLDMPLSDAALSTYYHDMAQRYGITAGKLKVGRDPDRDLERLALMRDAIADGSGITRPSLMVDANEFWTPKQAIRRISEIERQFDLVWAEEPVRRDDHRGLARVSRGIRAAVATGENLTSISQFVPLVLNEAADVVQVSVQATGITAALRIARDERCVGTTRRARELPGPVRRACCGGAPEPPDDGGRRRRPRRCLPIGPSPRGRLDRARRGARAWHHVRRTAALRAGRRPTIGGDPGCHLPPGNGFGDLRAGNPGARRHREPGWPTRRFRSSREG